MDFKEIISINNILIFINKKKINSSLFKLLYIKLLIYSNINKKKMYYL